MRLVSYRGAGGPTTALLFSTSRGDVLLDVAPVLADNDGTGGEQPGVVDLLADWPTVGDTLMRAVKDYQNSPELFEHAGAIHDAAEVELLAPVGHRSLIVCCGFNYADHEAEVGGSQVGATWFIKNANAVTGPTAEIAVPPDNGDRLDWEGEVAAVFARSCHRVAEDEALEYIGGYTLVNDLSIRLQNPVGEQSSDDLKRSVINSHLGKQYPTFLPVGPAVVTADEIEDPAEFTFTTTVNDQVVQTGALNMMRLDVARLVAWLSSVFRFEPGDMICTGSPAGSGVSMSPPRFLQDGDVVTITSPLIGSLRNPVRDTDPKHGGLA